MVAEKSASWTPGSLGYLVSSSWWTSWVQYSGYTGPGAAPSTTILLPLPGGGGPRPGPINNADLLPPESASLPAVLTGKDSPQATPLRPGLVEQQDFVVVSEVTWQRLHKLYSGGPAIARRVVSEAGPGPSGRSGERWARVALYPLRMEVVYRGKTDAESKSAQLTIEPEASLAALKQRACADLGVSEADVVLWDYSGRSPVCSLEEPLPGEATTADGTSAAAGAVADGTAHSATADAGEAASAGAALANGLGAEAGRTASANGAGAGAGGASSSMDVDRTAPASAPPPADEPGSAGGAAGLKGYMARPLRDVPLLDHQVLLLRRKDAADSDSEGEDACGSDNDVGASVTGRATAASRRRAAAAAGRSSGGGARPPAGEAAGAAAAAALRRASAAGASGSGSGGGTAPAPPARSSGGGTVQTFGPGNRQGQKATAAWDDNVLLRDGQLPGLAGLTNLGNTCFMNSSLQCLVHAVPLMTAFLGGAYLQDMNRTNPLGMKGELAEAFGSLMTQLWRGGVSTVTPRAFKAKIGRFAPQFSGYAQHDSQEFLAFLLDGLHEDTNRIKNKPYIEEKDQTGRPDEEVAAEAWANYRARNNSLVVDHFQGLFKSTLDCPQCGFNSVKFDPFMYLSLPLPESRRRVVEVVLVRMDGSELHSRMALELPSGGSVGDLLRATARAAGLPAEVSAAPASHLLAARPLRSSHAANSDELVLLGDVRMRLGDALEAGGNTTSYSLKSSASADQGLVVYYYPDAASGPSAAGMAPVIVHFKRPDRNRPAWIRGLWCGAPLVLYMPEDRPPYDPEQVHKVAVTPGTRSEYDIVGDCHLSAVLAGVLRPIQHRPLAPAEAPPRPSPPDGAAGPAQAADANTTTTAAAALTTDMLPPVLSAASLVEPAGAELAAGPALLIGGAAPDTAGLGTASAAAAPAAGPMEEDDPVVSAPAVAAAAAAEPVAELRPGTPSLDGEGREGGASGAGSRTLAGRRSSSGGGAGELMEGLEPIVVAPLPAPASAGARAAGGDSGGDDASMPGTPQPAASGAMEEDVMAAPAGSLPAVILAGPPQDAAMASVEDASGGPAVEPFNMWAAQEPSGAPAGPAAGAAAPAAAASGPPYTLKLCNSKGDASMWGSNDSKDINKAHHREFLLFFSESCSSSACGLSAADATAAGGPPGPYDADHLDAPAEHPSLAEHRRRSAAGPQPVSLDDCMTTFLQPERLAETDAWYCPRCKAHVCADKKLDLWSLPEVLVVHLKRFSYTRYSRNKLDTRVDFPLHSLDLGRYVMRPQGVAPLYDLFAVSNHYGSLGGGHYTAYAKLPSPPRGQEAAAGTAAEGADGASVGQAGSEDSWYCFDDSHVSHVDAQAVRTPAAYVLFYRRRAEAAADPPSLPDMLERLREQRAAALAAADATADGAGRNAGSPGSGSDRHPDQDQDRPTGRARAASVSIAAAAEAAKAARGGSGDEEELEVQPRSLAAFTEARRGSAGADGRPSAGSGGGAAAAAGCDDDLYGDANGLAVTAPSSPTPMSEAHTQGVGVAGIDLAASTPVRHGHGREALLPSYNADDFDAFTVGAAGGGGRGAAAGGGAGDVGHSGLGGYGGDGDGELGLVQPPGSPAEVDANNADLSGLYDEVDAMDSDRRRHSGSDMATSTGDNDRDDDVLGADDPGQDAAAAAGVAGGEFPAPPPSPPPARRPQPLSLMSTSPE